MSLVRLLPFPFSPGCRSVHVAAGMLAMFVLCRPPLHAQNVTAKPSGSGDGVGFAIESEMLTYRAVETNSEAVACDLAAYLYKVQVTFDSPPADSKERQHPGSKCAVKPTATGEPVVVVVFPFDQSLADAF